MIFDKKKYNITISITALALVVTLAGMMNESYLLLGIGIAASIVSTPFLLKAKLDYYRNVRDLKPWAICFEIKRNNIRVDAWLTRKCTGAITCAVISQTVELNNNKNQE